MDIATCTSVTKTNIMVNDLYLEISAYDIALKENGNIFFLDY